MANDWEAAVSVLRLANRLVDGIQDGLARRGFDDVRPVHGFAFARIGAGRTTLTDLAGHLGMTKQSAAQVVEYLEQRGYVTRTADPHDARARPIVLTDRGVACTRAARAAAEAVVRAWRLPPDVTAALIERGGVGPLRPAW